MKNDGERSLKALNVKWLVLLAIVDIVVVLMFVAPELIGRATIPEVGAGRMLMAPLMPVVILLVVNVLPHDIKSVLVYWKPRGVLPGHQAFTKYGPADGRIDMAVLRKNIGALPTEPIEQNSRWYQLYKMVSNEPAVAEAHKLFLMYRDMAAISLSLVVLIPATLYFAGASATVLWLAAALFAAQYLLTAVSARWSGTRFVCNVLAEHSARKVAAAKTSSTKQRAPGQ